MNPDNRNNVQERDELSNNATDFKDEDIGEEVNTNMDIVVRPQVPKGSKMVDDSAEQKVIDRCVPVSKPFVLTMSR